MTDFKEKYNKGLGLRLSGYDKRDFHFGEFIPTKFINIPENYATTDADFTYDQGESSMCCSCAYSFIRFLQEKDQSGLKERFAPAYTYAGRDANEMYEGMDIRSCMKHGQKDGNVLWRELPFFGTLDEVMAKYNEKHSDLLLKAEPFTTNSYYCCYTRRELQTAILLYKAVLIGVPVYDNFYSPVDGKIEFIPGMQSNGGHAISLYGWKIIDGNFYWLMKNSWGAEWGINGSAYLSEKYPWLENAWAIIDKHSEMTYDEYINTFYKNTIAASTIASIDLLNATIHTPNIATRAVATTNETNPIFNS